MTTTTTKPKETRDERRARIAERIRGLPVLLHAGTVVALLSYFWRDYWSLFVGLFGMDDAHNNREARRVVLLMVIATIPAVVIGFTLRKYIAELFASPVICAAMAAGMRSERREVEGVGAEFIENVSQCTCDPISCQ